MKVKLTSEDEEKIYELYKNGISMKNIANQYGTSFNKISKTINIALLIMFQNQYHYKKEKQNNFL